MSNIRVLDLSAKPKAEVVEMARTILDLAEAGDIVDLSWFATNHDGSTSTGFTPTDDAHRRLANAYRIAHRMQLKMDEQTE